MPKRAAPITSTSLLTDKLKENLISKESKEILNGSDSEESVYSGLEEESDSDSDISNEETNKSSENESQSEPEENESETDDELSENESDIEDTKENEQSIDRSNEGEEKQAYEFEEADTSDEEDIRNTVGNIPMEWYDEYKHFGYDLLGKKLVKGAEGDEIDNFLKKIEDADYWRTVYDKTNKEDIKLSKDQVDIIERIQKGYYAESSYDPYEPYVDWFTGDKMITPIKDGPQSKSSFIPSKWEHKKVIKIVRAIRNGWIKPKKEKNKEPQYYLLWDKDDKFKDRPNHWPAPKLKLPGHGESYNPPAEFLPTEEEKLAWENADPEDRSQNFLSKKYDSLRKVPGYSKFIEERFDRCLDLYLCPRQRKVRLNIDPNDLIPNLPRPKDLQPFPTTEFLQYLGHTDIVRCISVDPSGQWLASGSSDKTIRLWEILTGRCLKVIQCNGIVQHLAWNPQESIPILVAAVENCLLIINPELGDKLLSKDMDKTMNDVMNITSEASQEDIDWLPCDNIEKTNGIKIKIKHKKAIKQLNWHRKGDYLAVLMPQADTNSVVIHQLSKRASQCPLRKSKGQVQCVSFHPTRPFFFIATQRYVRVYNLQKQLLIKKLVSGVKWISSIDIHPKGDNVIIGSFDKRLCWFDMDLSTKPYKTLRHHKRAVRQVCFHRKYPLFASGSDDGSLIVCHGTVYGDLMQNPLIVPLKILRGHHVVDDLGVTDACFHPHQPWLFSSGADKTIRLFT